MYVECAIWTVARTGQGTAVLIRQGESGKSLPLYVTPLEAQIILNNLGERKEGKSYLYDFISQLCRGADVNIKRIELGRPAKDTPEAPMKACVRSGRLGEDDFTIMLGPAEAMALAARFSLPVHVEEDYFEEKGVTINLVEIETTAKKKKLEKKLTRLIAREEYEEAALIRDKLIALDGLNKENSK